MESYTMKTLKKSNNRKIFGVCGGIADYFGIDPSIIRLAVVVLSLFSVGTGIIVYIIAALIMPENTTSYEEDIDNLKSANLNDNEPESSNTSSSAHTTSGHTDEEFNSYFDEK